MTPPRLTELRCPCCAGTHWVIDSDFRGMDAELEEPYERRAYACPRCSHRGASYQVVQQSPPAFLLQPHPLYPMSESEFAYWVGILREHFPDHPSLRRLGSDFVPYTPEQAGSDRRAFEALYPVAVIRDQDGATRRDPTYAEVEDWLDMMRPGDTLAVSDRHGAEIVVTCDAPAGFSVRPVSDGARTLDRTQVLRLVRDPFCGRGSGRS